MEKNEKQLGEVKKRNGEIRVNFAISDCPVWLYKWFTDEKDRFGDIYWVRLKELHDTLVFYEDKLNLYEKLLGPGESSDEELTGEEQEKKKKAEKYVSTFGGKELIE
jgi:hypothetical protein